MAIDGKYKMSEERLAALKNELHILETDKAKEVAEQIKEARSFGDLSENSEYDEAKSEQAKLYTRIAEVQDLIANAEIVDHVEVVNAFAVSLGSKVKVCDIDAAEEDEFEIVGSQEANPMENRISDDSPLGRALYGHVAGDKVKVDAPMGEMYFEIISVEND